MAKPTILTRLVKGKALGAFPNLVDTWNYIVDFIENLRGDGDEDKAKSIVVDRTVDDHPVIRLNDSEGSNLEVITDVEFVIEDGFLQLKLTKAKIKNVTFEEIEYDEEIHRRPVAGALTGKSIVVDTHYNKSSDHIFKQDKFSDMLILYPKDAESVPTKDTENVFLTTLHT